MNIPRPFIARKNRKDRLTLLLFAAGLAAVWLLAIGTIGYIASHFILKYW